MAEIRYQTYDSLPEWAKPAVKKRLDAKALVGDEKGNLDLSLDMLRIWTVEDNQVYKTLDDVPEWGKETIEKKIKNGTLVGDGKGNINVTQDMLRIWVIDEREVS